MESRPALRQRVQEAGSSACSARWILAEAGSSRCRDIRANVGTLGLVYRRKRLPNCGNRTDPGGSGHAELITISKIETMKNEVTSTHGDEHLTGDNVDQRLIDFLAEEFNTAEGIDLRKDPMALVRLRQAAKQATIELSRNLETNVNLPFITATAEGHKHLNVNITRARFEQLGRGSARIPKVQQIVSIFFGKKPSIVRIVKSLLQTMKNEPLKTLLILAVVVALSLLAFIACDMHAIRKRIAPILPPGRRRLACIEIPRCSSVRHVNDGLSEMHWGNTHGTTSRIDISSPVRRFS